jgi:hypothetical protein
MLDEELELMSSRSAVLRRRPIEEPPDRDGKPLRQTAERREPRHVGVGLPTADTRRRDLHPPSEIQLAEAELLAASNDPLAHGFDGHASRFDDFKSKVKDPVGPFLIDARLRRDVPARGPQPPKRETYSVDASWKREVKARLLELGMDQKTLAQRVGITPGTMSVLLAPNGTKSSDVIPDIHKALGWPAPQRTSAPSAPAVPIASTDVGELGHFWDELSDDERLAILVLKRSGLLSRLTFSQVLELLGAQGSTKKP